MLSGRSYQFIARGGGGWTRHVLHWQSEAETEEVHRLTPGAATPG